MGTSSPSFLASRPSDPTTTLCPSGAAPQHKIRLRGEAGSTEAKQTHTPTLPYKPKGKVCACCLWVLVMSAQDTELQEAWVSQEGDTGVRSPEAEECWLQVGYWFLRNLTSVRTMAGAGLCESFSLDL